MKCIKDLHSTMFIFIFVRRKEPVLDAEFTFHYVYIYIPPIIVNPIINHIYIPLCLYLYLLPGWEQVRDPNLHSTMFIFIWVFNFICSIFSLFTFHYVYIYIRIMSFATSVISVFTFHYVYIYISQSCNFTSGWKLFTFHYVYIYMELLHF